MSENATPVGRAAREGFETIPPGYVITLMRDAEARRFHGPDIPPDGRFYVVMSRCCPTCGQGQNGPWFRGWGATEEAAIAVALSQYREWPPRQFRMKRDYLSEGAQGAD